MLLTNENPGPQISEDLVKGGFMGFRKASGRRLLCSW